MNQALCLRLAHGNSTVKTELVPHCKLIFPCVSSSAAAGKTGRAGWSWAQRISSKWLGLRKLSLRSVLILGWACFWGTGSDGLFISWGLQMFMSTFSVGVTDGCYFQGIQGRSGPPGAKGIAGEPVSLRTLMVFLAAVVAHVFSMVFSPCGSAMQNLAVAEFLRRYSHKSVSHCLLWLSSTYCAPFVPLHIQTDFCWPHYSSWILVPVWKCLGRPNPPSLMLPESHKHKQFGGELETSWSTPFLSSFLFIVASVCFCPVFTSSRGFGSVL